MKSQSSTKQNVIESYQGGLLISFNPVQKERQGMNGTETYWECDQIHLFGIPTKSAIKQAVKDCMKSDEQGTNEITLDLFKVTQKEARQKAIKDFKATNKIQPTDPLTVQTKEQMAGYLALQDFIEKIEADQKIELEAKVAELKEGDFKDMAATVATEVMTALNQ
jgi:hypothetical protein